MADTYRKERIERLLSELEYEVTRGVMDREIEPDLQFHKLMPCGRDTAVLRVHLHKVAEPITSTGPARLRVVK